MEKLYHQGVMRTELDDCQFVCITQSDYYKILNDREENQKIVKDDNGQVVLVSEFDGSIKNGKHFITLPLKEAGEGRGAKSAQWSGDYLSFLSGSCYGHKKSWLFP